MDDFQALEAEARRVALEVMGRAVARRLNADRSDEAGPRLPCRCGCGCGGGEARFAGRRPKTFTTALGPMTLERAWYHCDGCGHGFSPRDRDLGMAGSSLSPAVLRMVGVAAARTSFDGSSDLMRELAGLRIAPKTVERHAEALGREVAADELAVIEPEPSDAPTLYLGLDGTGVPVRRSETAGREGRQADGSAKTREAKLAVVWSAESTDRDGRPVRDPGSATHNAAIESIAGRDADAEPAPFARRVLREAERRGFDGAARQAVLGDGAAWIWNFADEHFPDAVQIVDVFHAKQHLFDTAKAIHGRGADLADAWGKLRRDELDQGRIDDLIAELDTHASSCEAARKDREYFSRNRQRMRYPEFRAMGLCVATGVVEGGCKSIVAGRLKQGGMRWTVNGANAIIALRCAIESNRFDDFWERRAAKTA
ncbi:MAG: ISKra4 family transposase [Gammaproteobacteria bacterium]|nr:ISKra4 family transposase [Gammaproteobacteria bacterium]